MNMAKSIPCSKNYSRKQIAYERDKTVTMATANFRTTALQAWDIQTPWTLLLGNVEVSPKSMEKLLILYADPVYAFYRKEGLSSADSEDLTQQLLMSFFLVRRSHLATQPTKGRFRDYLLIAAKNMLLDWRKGTRAKKRGGSDHTLSLSELKWDDHVWEPAGGSTPNDEYDRQWARTTWAAALEIFRSRQPAELTATLEIYYQGDTKASQNEAASKLNISVACFNSRLHRARKCLHQVLQDLIRATVDNEFEVAEEMARLRELLSR